MRKSLSRDRFTRPWSRGLSSSQNEPRRRWQPETRRSSETSPLPERKRSQLLGQARFAPVQFDAP
jgi:hypothetical protein